MDQREACEESTQRPLGKLAGLAEFSNRASAMARCVGTMSDGQRSVDKAGDEIDVSEILA